MSVESPSNQISSCCVWLGGKESKFKFKGGKEKKEEGDPSYSKERARLIQITAP